MAVTETTAEDSMLNTCLFSPPPPRIRDCIQGLINAKLVLTHWVILLAPKFVLNKVYWILKIKELFLHMNAYIFNNFFFFL